jgi:formylglycine-generating enzyme required for sulfatase activity
MGQTEVTIRQFKAFVDATGYVTDAERMGASEIENSTANGWISTKGVTWRCNSLGQPADASQWNLPVTFVSWNDAVAYCEWLSAFSGKPYRLPTEAEWEYAAGNGSKHTEYSWGNGLPQGKKGGNIYDLTKMSVHPTSAFSINYTDGFVYASPVGFFSPNELGLFDMSGNVGEWCSDWYFEVYAVQETRDPKGPTEGVYRVIRGGTWNQRLYRSKTVYREAERPLIHNAGLGFRIVRSVNY